MNTSKFGSFAGKVLIGLALVTMIGSLKVTPAFSRDDHKRMERHDNGRYEHRGRGYDRDRYQHHGRGRHDNRYYSHRERVYVAPPVLYAPPPPPGISIFFPPLFIRP